MNIVRCLYDPIKVAQKRKAVVFGLKLHFAWRKSATKFLCVKTVTNSKSHTGFRLIPTSMTLMTLNDLERRNSPHFAFLKPNSIALLANYVTVVEDRPIMSVRYCLSVPVFQFLPELTHPAARFLCDSWATYWLYFADALTIAWLCSVQRLKIKPRRGQKSSATIRMCLVHRAGQLVDYSK